MSNERLLTFHLDQNSLFKYCDERGIDILKSLRLKVTPPNQFNDPFEFLPKVDFCFDETDVKNLLTDRHRLRLVWKQSGLQVSFEDYCATLRKGSENAGFVKHYVANAQTRLQDFALKSQIDVVDFLSETYALACFSEIPENALMWSHYSHGHRGIVVEFDAKNPFIASAVNLVPVNYCSERVSARYDFKGFNFDGHELSVVRTKSPAWSYEREWRQLFQVKDCTKIHNPDGTTCFYVSVPSDAIASVIFGVRCGPQTEEIVRDLKKRADLQHVRLSRAVLHERDFKINVVPADDK